MTLADIIAALFIVPVVALVWWCGYAFGRGVERSAALCRRMTEPCEPETHGDDGGRPADGHQAAAQRRAPETGSGLRAGDR